MATPALRRHLGAAQRRSLPTTAPRRCIILQGNFLDGPWCAGSGHGPVRLLLTTVILFEPEVTECQRADPLFTALLNRLWIAS